MPSIKTMAVAAAAADFVFCGLLSNGFITAVMISGWAKRRNIAACEQLFLSLGISNIWAPVLQITELFIHDRTTTFKVHLFQSFRIYVVMMRYWLTAWLCVFYCVKILSSTHPFILWWKMRISRLMPWLIIGSCVISSLVSLAMMVIYFRQMPSNGTANITNVTQKVNMEEIRMVAVICFFVTGSGCPLVIVFLCSILIVYSLCRHIYRLTSKGSEFKNLQTGALVKAARTVLSLLFLYISYYVAQTLDITVVSHKNQISFYVNSTVMWMYSPVQAAILGLSNPKLKQTMLWTFTRTKS